MANCKDCWDYDYCKASDPNEGVYPEDVNDVETKCDGFEAKEKTMEKGTIKKEDRLISVLDEQIKVDIKAAGYDVIKEIMEEQMKMDYEISGTFNIIDGVIRMGEAVTAALIK